MRSPSNRSLRAWVAMKLLHLTVSDRAYLRILAISSNCRLSKSKIVERLIMGRNVAGLMNRNHRRGVVHSIDKRDQPVGSVTAGETA